MVCVYAGLPVYFNASLPELSTIAQWDFNVFAVREAIATSSAATVTTSVSLDVKTFVTVVGSIFSRLDLADELHIPDSVRCPIARSLWRL